MRQSFGVLVFVLALTPACGNEGDADFSVITRDSAGITIIEYQDDPVRQGSYRVTAEVPDLELGSRMAAGPELFDDIAAAYFLEGGQTVVGERGTGELRLFDGRGAHLATLGGRGGGPAEFEMLQTSFKGLADTVVALDARGPKVVKFSSGRFVGSSVVEPPGTAARLPVVVGAFDDGSVLATAVEPGPSTGNLTRPQVQVISYSSWGARQAVVGSFLGPERTSVKNGPVVTSHIVPLGRSSYIRAWGEGFVAADNYLSELQFYTQSGALRSIVRWPSNLDSDGGAGRLQAYVDSVIETVEEGQRPAVRSMLESLPRSPGYPVIDGMIGTDDGSVWVRTSATDANIWLDVAPRDGIRTRVHLPPSFQPTDIREGRVLGIWRDALGVQFVRAYRLQPPSD
ncbi:MAG TPA: hypothetical protein VLH75_03800 [Longimicrobiales bacterium]|nr:hypothetical protein [Longimicrobiales bacterium]